MKHHSDSAEPGPSGAEAANDPTDMERLFGAVEASLARERGVAAWLRARPTWQRVSIAGVSLIAMVAAVSAWVPRAQGFQAYPAFRLWATIGAYAVVLGVLLSEALRPLQRIEAHTHVVRALAGFALAAPFVLALWPSARPTAFPPPRDCMALGLVVGSALIMVLRTLDRADSSEPRAILTAAAAAGITGNLALMFHCTDSNPLHLFVAHASQGLLFWWGYRALLSRAARRAIQRTR